MNYNAVYHHRPKAVWWKSLLRRLEAGHCNLQLQTEHSYLQRHLVHHRHQAVQAVQAVRAVLFQACGG